VFWLGVLPAEIVVHRNAVYYLWHLRRRAWFKQYLPDLARLQPIQRLTSTVLQYSSLQLSDIDRLEYDHWRLAVKHAVLKRAQTALPSFTEVQFPLEEESPKETRCPPCFSLT